MTADEALPRIEEQLAHVWMVRTFLKHCDEAGDDDELMDVVRELYDFSLALGGPLKDRDADAYVKQARKKLAKLRAATDSFVRLQPEISTHTNFQMAASSLTVAVREIERLLEG